MKRGQPYELYITFFFKWCVKMTINDEMKIQDFKVLLCVMLSVSTLIIGSLDFKFSNIIITSLAILQICIFTHYLYRRSTIKALQNYPSVENEKK